MEQFKKFRTTIDLTQFFRKELEKLGHEADVSPHPIGGFMIKNPLSQDSSLKFMASVRKEMKRQPYAKRFLYSDESNTAKEEREKVLKQHEAGLKSILEDLKDDSRKEQKMNDTLELLLDGIPTPHFWVRETPVKKVQKKRLP